MFLRIKFPVLDFQFGQTTNRVHLGHLAIILAILDFLFDSKTKYLFEMKNARYVAPYVYIGVLCSSFASSMCVCMYLCATYACCWMHNDESLLCVSSDLRLFNILLVIFVSLQTSDTSASCWTSVRLPIGCLFELLFFFVQQAVHPCIDRLQTVVLRVASGFP